MEFKKVYWSDIRKKFISVNPKIGEIIDKLEVSKKYYFYYAEYNYGSYILKKGKLQIPISDKLIPLEHTTISPIIQNDLNYNLGSTNPVSIILNNTTEIFTDIDSSIIPLYGLINPGSIFSTSRILSEKKSSVPTLIWDMTAGARSIFIPQKLSEKRANTALKRAYQLKNDPPKALLDQWDIFKNIANHSSWGKPWKTTILFFTRQWFEHKNDPAWQSFYLYLYQSAWLSSDFWRNQFLWDIAFSAIQIKHGIKPSQHIDSITRYLLAIGMNASPGFSVTSDNKHAPIERIITAYKNVYKGCDNYETILVPQFYNDSDHPLYLSLNMRMWLNSPIKNFEKPSFINYLCEIRSLLSKYIIDLSTDELNIKGSIMEDVVKNTEFKFFHNGQEQYYGIENSHHIINYDKHLKIKNPDILISSPFFRSCIQIFKKKL